MKNAILRASCTGVFVVGLLVFCLAQNKNQAKTGIIIPEDVEPTRPFVVTIVQYRVTQDGSRTVLTRSTRHQKANGEYRQVSSGADGRLTIYAGLADGVYKKPAGSSSLTYESQRSTDEMSLFYRSAKSMRDSPNYVRTERIAGLKAFVMRHETNSIEGAVEWAEESCSPKTGRVWLRMLVHFRDGTEVVSEAEQIDFEDVPDNLNADLKDLPISNLEEKRRKQSQE